MANRAMGDEAKKWWKKGKSQKVRNTLAAIVHDGTC